MRDWFDRELPPETVNRLVFRFVLWFSLVCVILYFYPNMDQLIHQWRGDDIYIYSLTLYHPLRYGVLHIPSALFGVLVFGCLLVANWLVSPIMLAGEWIATQLSQRFGVREYVESD